MDKPDSCANCDLSRRGRGFNRATGSGTNGVMLLGDLPNKDAIYKGVAFGGRDAAQLQRILEFVDARKDDFLMTNLINCSPPGELLKGMPWCNDAVGSCKHFLREAIMRHKPKVIVPMDELPLNELLDRHNIIKQHGYVHQAFVQGHLCYVIPTLHPRFVIEGNTNMTPVVVNDLTKALRVSREGFKEPEYDYWEHPSADMMEAFAENAAQHKVLTVDIETPTSAGVDEEDELGEIKDVEITRFSVAYEPHKAMTLRWNEYNKGYLQALLVGHEWDWITFWNADFDVPRLKGKGILIDSDRILDSMWMWHFLQSDLPKSLAFVTPFFTELTEWKSLSGSHPEFYSCRDADSQIQNTLRIMELLKQQKRFDAFVKHVVRLEPRRKQLGRAGVLIDSERRAEFRVLIDKDLQRVDAEIQDYVPDGVKQRKVYKRKPKGAVEGGEHRVGKVVGKWEVKRVKDEA